MIEGLNEKRGILATTITMSAITTAAFMYMYFTSILPNAITPIDGLTEAFNTIAIIVFFDLFIITGLYFQKWNFITFLGVVVIFTGFGAFLAHGLLGLEEFPSVIADPVLGFFTKIFFVVIGIAVAFFVHGKTRTPTKTCIACHETMKKEWNFCPFCGAKIPEKT